MFNGSRKSWEEYRRKMLQETERFIEWGLAHPDEVIEIPTKPGNQGGFPKSVAQWFWGVVLSDKVTGGMKRWRSLLRRRPRREKSRIDLGRRRSGHN
jgi:hypothetical protein